MSRQRFLLWGLGFLVLSVPLAPYRYFRLPAGMPEIASAVLRQLPAAVCLVLGGMWCWRRRAELRRGLGQLPLGWPVGALLLTGLLSAMGARHPAVSLAKTVYYFATGGLLFWVLTDRQIGPRQARWLLYALIGAGYAAALYGVVEFAAGRNVLYGYFFDPGNEAYRRLVPDPWFERRILSTMGHPVFLGSYLLLILPVSLGAALGAPSRRLQLVLLAGSAAVAGALGLTFTRGAWLGAGVGLAVFLAMGGLRRLLLLPVGLAVVAALALMVGGIAEVAGARLQEAYSSYLLNFSATTRGAAYGYVAAIANHRPLTGLGTGMYRFAVYELRRTLDIPAPLGVSDTPDNMYLIWLAENGTFGLAAWVYLLVALLSRMWGWSQRAPDAAQRLLAWGFMAAFAGLAVNLLTVDALYFPVIRIVFWIMAGLAVTLSIPISDKVDD